MSLSTSVHDIKMLVLSSHPIIVIETVEEDRVRSLLLSVAAQLRMPFFEWSVTRGLTRAEEPNAIYRITANPLALLQHLDGLTVAGIFLLKDLSRHLEDAATARQFRELAERFTQRRSTSVLTGETVQLPGEIQQEAVRYDLRLPDQDELLTVINHVLTSLGKNPLRDVQLAPLDCEELLRALQGLTLNQARQAVSQAVLEDGKLTATVVHDVLNRKAQAIREGGLLEYYPVEDNR